MNFKEYQEFTKTTAIYPQEKALEHLTLGLTSEAGEVAGVVKKWVRKDYDTREMLSKLKAELGDCCWYIVRLADELDISIEDILYENYQKLMEGKNNQTLQGNGDDR